MTDQRRTWQRLMGPVWRRIRLLVSRGVVKLVDDSLKLQGVQVSLLGDEPAWAERFQDYGHTSHPHPGAEAVVAAVGGARAHLVALAIDDRRYRLKDLAEGEVAMYDDLGNVIVFRRDKIQVQAVQHLEVTAPTCHITATTNHDGNVTINGNLVVNGSGAFTQALSSATSVADPKGTMQAMRNTYNGHNHDENNTSGPTDPPNQEMT
ncbi:phage baseplate assembly protein V [Marinobacter halodurans]|uniref:Phage baseplate assembly protein V n=1 Tax=Marinobacter halodurans TaxID=2528979 RepID=A0ABY1ZTJ5_9GAMM|nr:phage baseplate assembly protein V [Marinobacter halodurans]TBW58563.1 phage baseplate assembly protein V [Marinobacter halodurans]